MFGVTFSMEEIRSAPADVRRWMEAQLRAAFAGSADERPVPSETGQLAAATVEDVRAVFELIKGDHVATRVFFELGEDAPTFARVGDLIAIPVGDLIRRARLSDPQRLVGAIEAIAAAYNAVRGNAQSALLGFDTRGYVFLHGTTHARIAALWEEFAAATEQGLPTVRQAARPPLVTQA